MKVRHVFYILLLFTCSLIPFSPSFTEISLVNQTPCVRLNSWTVGQSSGNYGKTLLTISVGSFITNSEQTCCVSVSVGYCQN